uniref:Phage_base_V domain-containing protein n=1 Tax=Heterorhabditis bacteriophora TaxID=37862 RepID=A0A1I7WYI5_HETBA
MSGDFPGVNEPLWAVICKVDGDCIYYWIPESGYSTKEVCLQNISEFDIGQWIVISADGNIMKVNDAPVPTFIIRSKGCRLVKVCN